MAANLRPLVEYVRRLVHRPVLDEAADAAVLSRFISDRDEAAFAAIVERHGPLVLHVCQRILGEVHDAEDAFQATFMVLARKAATVHPRHALAAWLHGVARRVALKARSARGCRLRAIQSFPVSPVDPHPDPLVDVSARELLSMVDAEVRRLPEVYRLPVILCCLEGLSLEETARRLGWTPGSVKGRLERGRALLHHRLIRRGLTLSAVLATAELLRVTGTASMVARWTASTVRAAMSYAADRPAADLVSANATALALEGVKDTGTRLKTRAALLLATGLLVAGFVAQRAANVTSTTGRSTRSATDQRGLEVSRDTLGNQAGPLSAETHHRIKVNGRVFDAVGKPLEGAGLYVGYSIHRYRRSASSMRSGQIAYPLRATSAADGRFQFTLSTSELDATWLDDSRPAVIAVAAGHGPDWAEIAESAESVELSLRLVEDAAMEGRLLDSDRRPVVGARVFVRDVLSDTAEGVTRFLGGETSSWSPKSWRGPLPGQAPNVITDDEGRFHLTGLGRDRVVRLALDGPAVQHSVFEATTRPGSPAAGTASVLGPSFDYVTRSSRTIRGLVRDKATGKPIAGVKMGAQETDFTTLTDEGGRFEILGCATIQRSFVVMAEPQTGRPYFAAVARVPERVGADYLTADFELASGIPLSGRVTEQSTRLPPRAAVVEYFPLYPNPYSSRISNSFMAASSTVTRPDGSYSLVVLPGPGVVCVSASPRSAYAVAAVDDKELPDGSNERDGRGECRRLSAAVGARGQLPLAENKYNAVLLINPDERAISVALDVMLQPGGTLKGTMVGPDGQPLTGVKIIGLTALPEDEVAEGSSFTVVGLNPRRDRSLFFHHSDKDLGKIVTIRGDEIGPLTVQLDPCGSVGGRLVDKKGKAVAGITVCFSPGYGRPDVVCTKSDREGRFSGRLLPGQKYSLGLRLLRNVGEVQVGSGQLKDLGDLPLAD
jgi:RNA polymerase sigma factor (sigma-70 family)